MHLHVLYILHTSYLSGMLSCNGIQHIMVIIPIGTFSREALGTNPKVNLEGENMDLATDSHQTDLTTIT